MFLLWNIILGISFIGLLRFDNLNGLLSIKDMINTPLIIMGFAHTDPSGLLMYVNCGHSFV